MLHVSLTFLSLSSYFSGIIGDRCTAFRSHRAGVGRQGEQGKCDPPDPHLIMFTLITLFFFFSKIIITCYLGFPGGSDGKESTCNAGDLGSILGFGRSPGGHGNPLQYSCLENLHGQRSLAGYSPRGHKEPDTTESQGTAQHAAWNSSPSALYTFYMVSITKL